MTLDLTAVAAAGLAAPTLTWALGTAAAPGSLYEAGASSSACREMSSRMRAGGRCCS